MAEVQTEMCGRPIWLAEGVRMGELNWYLECIIRCYQDVCAQYHVHPCITGGLDEPEGVREADHQDCRALDLRCRDFGSNAEAAAAELRQRLAFYGKRYIVKHLDMGFGWHYHVAWR